MAQNETKAVLVQVLNEVLGGLAFLLLDQPGPDGAQAGDGSYARVQLDFRGAMNGCFELVLPEELCREAAANIMGVDISVEIAAENKLDAAKELLNIISSHVVTRLAGADKTVDVGIPQGELCDAEGMRGLLRDKESVVLLADGNPVALRMRFQ